MNKFLYFIKLSMLVLMLTALSACMNIKNTRTGSLINTSSLDPSEASIVGDIGSETKKSIQKWLESNPDKELTLYLYSYGGESFNALSIADMIYKQHHVTTVVKANCASACTILWLSGNKRIVENNSSLEFHGSDIIVANKLLSTCSILAPKDKKNISFIDQKQKYWLEKQEPILAKILLKLSVFDLHRDGNDITVTKKDDGWIVHPNISTYLNNGIWYSSYPQFNKNLNNYHLDSTFHLVNQYALKNDSHPMGCNPLT